MDKNVKKIDVLAAAAVLRACVLELPLGCAIFCDDIESGRGITANAELYVLVGVCVEVM